MPIEIPLVNSPISRHQSLFIKQKLEMAELVGFETRNKYAIETEKGELVGFAAEQQKSWIGFLLRQILGHWREFTIVFFDNNKNEFMTAYHPFRFIFQRLEIKNNQHQSIGVLQQRFSVFSKHFEIQNTRGQVLMSVQSPIWKPWTFPFQKHNRTVATIMKKWSGVLGEMFTDKDQFKIEFNDPNLSEDEKLILVAASIFIDMQYFERKAG
jgi:uncharacterized protein YxjI